MNRDPAAFIFIVYFVVWTVLAIISTVHLRTLRNPKDKQKWSDRYTLIVGGFVLGTMCTISVLWKQYTMIPVFLLVGGLIAFLNLRCSFYCESCGNRSRMQNPFASIFYCSHWWPQTQIGHAASLRRPLKDSRFGARLWSGTTTRTARRNTRRNSQRRGEVASFAPAVAVTSMKVAA